MEYQRFGNQYVLKLDPEEEVRASLTGFLEREDIRAGYFLAFGAFSRVKLRYFDYNVKFYRDHILDQQVEVVSLLGNIARVDGKPRIHMHAAVANSQIQTFSGDIAEGVVRPTLELFLTKFEGELRRTKDPETGLELLELAQREAQPEAAKRRKAA